MNRYGVPLLVSVACVMAVSGCGSPKTEAPAAGQPAIKVSSKAVGSTNHAIKITFSTKNNVPADCSARIAPGQKKTTVHHTDSVTWTLENSNSDACGAYNGDDVTLKFDKHVFVEGETLRAKNGLITGTIDDSAANHTDATYTVNLRDKDAGDPEIDVNDCSPPATPTEK